MARCTAVDHTRDLTIVENLFLVIVVGLSSTLSILKAMTAREPARVPNVPFPFGLSHFLCSSYLTRGIYISDIYNFISPID